MDIQDEYTLPLRKPLTTAKGDVQVLELREPTAGELDKFTRAQKDGPIAAVLTLVSLVTGIEKPFLDKLGTRDFNAAAQYLSGFINASPEIGETE